MKKILLACVMLAFSFAVNAQDFLDGDRVLSSKGVDAARIQLPDGSVADLDLATDEASLEVMDFGGNRTYYFNIKAGEESTSFCWSGNDKFRLMAQNEGGTDAYFVVDGRRQNIVLAFMYVPSGGKTVLVVRLLSYDGATTGISKGMTVDEIKKHAKANMCELKYVRDECNLSVYEFLLPSMQDTYDGKVNVTGKKNGEFHFDAQGKLVRWYTNLD